MLLAEWIVTSAGLYAVAGLLFGIIFVFRGVGSIDPAARNAGLGFRLIILPGVVALWPVLLRRWRRGES